MTKKLSNWVINLLNGKIISKHYFVKDSRTKIIL